MNASALPLVHRRTNISAPLAALLAGAALSAGVIAIADSDDPVSQPAKVVVLEASPPTGQGMQAKDEAAIANAISPELELRGSKASATGAAGDRRPSGARRVPPGRPARSGLEPRQPMTTALEARSHLSDLELERALAGTTPLAGVAAYMVDLEEEIAAWRSVYIGAAVTEIASLRGELFGPQVG